MKNTVLLSVALFCGMNAVCDAHTWNIEYGKDAGKVAFYNAKSDPNFAEDAPYGPMSYRVINNNLWVLDSIAGKLSCFDNSGKNIKTISIPGLEGFILLEDFAFADNKSVWVANAADSVIRKISLADGKVLTKIGGNGDEAGKILQVHQMEADSNGRLYVADIARNKLTVFSETGSFIREFDWQSSGFAVDKKSNLHLLRYNDNSGYFHYVYNSNGQLISSNHLGFINNTNTRLVSVAEDGSIVLSMVPEGGFRGVMNLYKVSQNGVLISQADYIPPSSMNREVYVDNNKVFIAEADFATAPSTKFVIKEINWQPANVEKEVNSKE